MYARWISIARVIAFSLALAEDDCHGIERKPIRLTAHQSFTWLRLIVVGALCSSFFDRSPYLVHGNSASVRRDHTNGAKKGARSERRIDWARINCRNTAPVPPSRRERAPRTELRTCVGKCAGSVRRHDHRSYRAKYTRQQFLQQKYTCIFKIYKINRAYEIEIYT